MKKVKKHFKKTGCGRKNPEAIRVAKAAGISIHQLQSIYYGRKGASPESAERILAAL